MKSTKENLHSVFIRLTTIGLVLFVCAELMMAFMAIFFFIPEQSLAQAQNKNVFLRVGIEKDEFEFSKRLIKHKMSSKIDYNVIDLRDGVDAIFAIKNGLVDVVCTDAISAKYMMQKSYAVPLAYLQTDKAQVDIERLILIGHQGTPQFISQTQGKDILLTGSKGKFQRVIGETFLKYKVKDLKQWFNKVSVSLASEYALERLKTKKADLVLILESDFRRIAPGEKSNEFKIVWYSEPLARKVIMVHKDLDEMSTKFVTSLFDGKDSAGGSWKLFDESLEKIENWNFRISGKPFVYNDKLIKEIISK